MPPVRCSDFISPYGVHYVRTIICHVANGRTMSCPCRRFIRIMKDGSILVVYWKDFFVGEVDENHEREVLERRQECAL
jgi:hypothetical protein